MTDNCTHTPVARWYGPDTGTDIEVIFYAVYDS